MTNRKSGFMRTMLSIAVPVTLQNLLFSSFTLIDTLMIGALGDTPLAAVGMAGKWTWFYTIVLFGFSSGASVFIAQYFGAGDIPGIHRTYGLLGGGALAVSLAFMSASLVVPERIVGLFSNDPEAVAIGAAYLRVIALSYPFQALARSGGTLLQGTQRVMIPFAGALVSVAVNVAFNALLIFGLCGFPALGATGAAIASTLAAAVNAAVIYAGGLARGTLLRAPLRRLLAVDGAFAKSYARVSAPALLNETIWAMGNLVYSAVFGHMGTGAYAAITVVKSIEDLTSVAFMGLCSSCAVMIGGMIGRGDLAAAKDCAKRHLLLTVGFSVVIGGGVLLARAPLLSLFGVSAQVRSDAAAVLMIYALEMVLRNIPLILVVGIFRAGGDTRFGLIVDSVSLYLIGVPLTVAAGLVLGLSVPATYLVMYLSEDVLKCAVYGLHMRSGKWIRPVTDKRRLP
ncbi:MAG: MATE family efflux transporter [Clostridia bacterium]|nr:MATE family efflux transporter [Clostridia bacterium]